MVHETTNGETSVNSDSEPCARLLRYNLSNWNRRWPTERILFHIRRYETTYDRKRWPTNNLDESNNKHQQCWQPHLHFCLHNQANWQRSKHHVCNWRSSPRISTDWHRHTKYLLKIHIIIYPQNNLEISTTYRTISYNSYKRSNQPQVSQSDLIVTEQPNTSTEQR